MLIRAIQHLLVLFLFVLPQSLAVTLNDTGQISKTFVTRVMPIKTKADLRKALLQANKDGLPISIMGKQHSQGGQTLAQDAVVLNMLSFNKVLNLDRMKKQVTVESGITWGELQKVINPYHLAITAMQSPNIFTVGGSLSANAHGDDFRTGSVGNSVVAFNLMLANGKEIHVTKKLHPDIWSAVIGGYGLLGVITEVTLQLTDNNLMVSHYQSIPLNQFMNYFRKSVLDKKEVRLFYAHVNIVPGEKFLREMYVITYDDQGKLPKKIMPLDNPDRWNVILTPTFNVSRLGVLGKQWRFKTEEKVFSKIYHEKIVTRNNAMEKPVTFASNYHSKDNADWLQEYFIPMEKLPMFIDKLRTVMSENNTNLLNVTLRYVPAETNTLLPYAKENAFAVVLYFNQDLAEHDIYLARAWTIKLIDAALLLGGNYYLTYQNFATLQQFQYAYPHYKKLLALKKTLDPKNKFVNLFYNHYFLPKQKSKVEAQE